MAMIDIRPARGGVFLSALLLLAACATAPPEGEGQEGAQNTRGKSVSGDGGSRTDSIGEGGMVLRLEDFDGGARADLEAVLGLPALTRREGDGLFLRYDRGPCRIYAFVQKPGEEGGEEIVTNLSLLPAKRADAMPSFSACLETGT